MRGHGLHIPVESSLPPVIDSARGMTRDDLDLLDFTVDRFSKELRLAVALHQPPVWVRTAVDTVLAERAIALPEGTEREHLDFQFLGATLRALEAIKKRNTGEFILTPPPVADPAEKNGPTLSETFQAWKDGSLLPGMKVPRQSTADEADFCVRRFREMHGNPRIGAITREQARTFCDALRRLPTRLPDYIERLPLPDILRRPDIKNYPARSSGTFGKHVTLMMAILNKGARAYDLKYRGSGWSNPFEGLKPESNNDERGRDPLADEELTIIFSSSIYTARERPHGGQGEAAFWLPVLGVMTGARLSELAQLRLIDVRTDRVSSVVYLDINDESGKKLKTKTSRRQVPIHPVLIDVGFMRYVAARRYEAQNDAALLFPGLEPRGKKAHRWAAAWSKWFNRWRRDRLKIDGHETRKDFHSLRHTFVDMTRAAQIEEEVHDALTGHSFKGGSKGVGRRYGAGVPLAVRAEAIRKLMPPAVIKTLRWNCGEPQQTEQQSEQLVGVK
jgi:integrase